ncbi:membrane protein [Lacticaseibacillus pantheris DSM 15945 = JCM 12539 = NBRC 106106]|uniref:Membrane protein n=1 Tax=Lacticaseibacillus pantheris DSM 15945 = JCM 12539 = NBRC 106106 TaxID=1423783 RepID=A0A0R1U5E1_9LACO|nr:AI-2E family transporter [Lacticaseibacillus pantheris]KRL86488.1 membrane protein [Lacticaseibacillus pantheris DSM 15945 = JCM 12539 = NBRC 106106]
MFERLRQSKLMFWSVEILILVLIIAGLSSVTFIFQPVATFFSIWLIPLVSALFLYYMFNPFVKMMERMKVPRGLALAILMLVLAGLVYLIVVWAVPAMLRQVARLVLALPTLVKDFQTVLAKASHYSWYQALDLDDAISHINASKITASILKSTSAGLPDFLGSAVGTFFSVITVPIIFFYMLKDGHRFVPAVQRLFPTSINDEVGEVFRRLNDTLAHYIAGQALECIFVGVMTGLGYWIIGQPYALLLAIIAGVVTMIPYLGPYIGIIPALLVSVNMGWGQMFGIVAVVIVVHVVDGNFIYPNIIGRSLDIHPVTIIILLLLASHLYGLLGTILSIPVYAVAKNVVVYLWQVLQLRRREKMVQEPSSTSGLGASKEEKEHK